MTSTSDYLSWRTRYRCASSDVPEVQSRRGARGGLPGFAVYVQRRYDANAYVTFFERIQADKKRRPGTIPKVFSTHPPTRSVASQPGLMDYRGVLSGFHARALPGSKNQQGRRARRPNKQRPSVNCIAAHIALMISAERIVEASMKEYPTHSSRSTVRAEIGCRDRGEGQHYPAFLRTCLLILAFAFQPTAVETWR